MATDNELKTFRDDVVAFMQGGGSIISGGGSSFILQPASDSVLGGVKVGYGLEMDSNNRLNCTISAGTLSVATTVSGGLMTAADKTKLDGIAPNANNYSLPAATTSDLGGVIVGTGLTVNKGTVSLAAAKAGTIGGVKPGNGLAITSDGQLYVSNSVILGTTESNVDGAMWYEV